MSVAGGLAKAARPIPGPDSAASLRALRAMIRTRSPMAGLQAFHRALGDVFQIRLPGFSPVFLVGPEAARFVLVEARDDLRWRNERDPVTHLLRHGVLVEDGESHEHLRALMNPSLHRRMLTGYVEAMVRSTDRVAAAWPAAGEVDMLVEMRKIALLILTETLFRVDFAPELERMLSAVLGNIRYISPGLWMLWPGAPRLGYRRALARMDDYLYRIIAERRALPQGDEPAADLLGTLIASGMEDGLIRDQLLTMLIAGHDTSTALLAWSWYLLGTHPEVLARAQSEVASVLGGGTVRAEAVGELVYLGQVMKEALRLYPPIHLGSRVAARDLVYQGYTIPAGQRVIYSIYLTQRHPDYWPDPDRFDPERHRPGVRPAPYTWLPFGGGPRNCIGGAFGQVEVKVVLARLLQKFRFTLVEDHVRMHMGATLEPHPGVRMRMKKI